MTFCDFALFLVQFSKKLHQIQCNRKITSRVHWLSNWKGIPLHTHLYLDILQICGWLYVLVTILY